MDAPACSVVFILEGARIVARGTAKGQSMVYCVARA